jgi:hypothetical protein
MDSGIAFSDLENREKSEEMTEFSLVESEYIVFVTYTRHISENPDIGGGHQGFREKIPETNKIHHSELYITEK